MMYLSGCWQRWFGHPTKMVEEKRTQTQELKQANQTARPLSAPQTMVLKPPQLTSLDDFVKTFVEGNDGFISSSLYQQKKWLDEMVHFAILVMIDQEDKKKNSIAVNCSTLVTRQLLTGISGVKSYLYQQEVSFLSIQPFIKYLRDEKCLMDNQPLLSENLLLLSLQKSISQLMLDKKNDKKIITILKDLVLKDVDIHSPSDELENRLQKKLQLTIPGLVFKTYLNSRIYKDQKVDIAKGLSGFAKHGASLNKIIREEKTAELKKSIQDDKAKQAQQQKNIKMAMDKELADLKAKRDDKLKQLNQLKYQQYLNLCFGGIPLLISYYADSNPALLIFPLFVSTHQSCQLLEAHSEIDQQVKRLDDTMQKNNSKLQELMTESEKKLDELKTEEKGNLGQLNSLESKTYWLVGQDLLFSTLYFLNYLSPQSLIFFLVLDSVQSYQLSKTRINVSQRMATLKDKIFETNTEQKVRPSLTTAITNNDSFPFFSSSALLSGQAQVQCQEQQDVTKQIRS